MEKKTARLTILIDPDKKKALEELCLQQDVTPSQVIRQLIRDYLHKHQVEYPVNRPIPIPGLITPDPMIETGWRTECAI